MSVNHKYQEEFLDQRQSTKRLKGQVPRRRGRQPLSRPLLPRPPPDPALVFIKGDRVIRRRKRKNTEQMKVLEYEFARDPEWTKERLAELSRMTGLSEGQIYKWGWDQKKKLASGEITMEGLQRIREAGPPIYLADQMNDESH